MTTTPWAAGFFALALVMTAGCEVQHSEGSNGQNSVKIATPFGGVHVKSDSSDTVDTGLATYPGATPAPKKDNNSDNADIGFNFGSFRMKIQVASYVTPDSPDKVLAFYRKNLAQYGDVLECVDGHSVGAKTQTSGGLTCSDSKDAGGTHISTGSDSKKHELRAGQPHHFHMAALDEDKTTPGHTVFALINLELPKGSDNTD